VEAQKINRFRGVRIVPVLRPETSKHLVNTLQRYVQIDDNPMIHTAPYRFGTTFSVLGIGQTESLLESSLLDVTDSISRKGLLETVYLKVGDQFVAVEVNTPLVPNPLAHYRTIGLYGHVFSTPITARTRDVKGKVLSVFDPFTAAGITLRLEARISGDLNLELADTSFFAGSIEALSVAFPDVSSLSAEDVRAKIHADLKVHVEKEVSLVGYDLDVDRLNHFAIVKYESQEVLQAAAATELANRYANQG
jgi:hypothetical protein